MRGAATGGGREAKGVRGGREFALSFVSSGGTFGESPASHGGKSLRNVTCVVYQVEM